MVNHKTASTVRLAIFDLDNTLIAGDSDYLWGQFLSRHGHVDASLHEARQNEFYQRYQAGTLDIKEFLDFQLAPLAAHASDTLLRWRMNYMDEMIRPVILPQARRLIKWHRDQGHRLLIITATNRFLTGPIADEFEIDDLIACEPEMKNGCYTGKITGVPSYAEGKVKRFNSWCKAHRLDIIESWFYSDSHNDIPLLQVVDHPVVVDPDPALRRRAEESGWPVISLRAADKD